MMLQGRTILITGGAGGLGRVLAQTCSAAGARIVLADPEGSGLYAYHTRGEMKNQGSSITEGIGIMRVTANYQMAKIDDAMQVSDKQMIDMLYHVSKHDGLCLGTSAALNLHAAYQLAMQNRGSGMRIATVLCDHGSRYTSKIFNQSFLADKGLVVGELA